MKNIKSNKVVTQVMAALTAVFIILVGIFCTSPSKAAERPIKLPETETVYGTDTKTPEETKKIIHYETIDAGVTDEATEGPSSDTNDPYGDTTDNIQTTVTETEPETTELVLSEQTYHIYTGRELMPNERILDSYESDRCSIIITKVSEGDLNYFICDVQIESPKDFHTAFAGGAITGRAYTSKTASQVGAALAVNGDFCGFVSSGIIIRESVLYRNKSSKWDFCYLDKNGDLVTISQAKLNGNDLVAKGVIQSWSFGPMLLKDGKALTTDQFVTPGLSRYAREPRTAIGQISDLHYIVLVVDAVRSGSSTIGGMTFADLSKTFEKIGCKTAYNLDGGGSTTLYFKGQVINNPCVNGERNVSDIIYFK